MREELELRRFDDMSILTMIGIGLGVIVVVTDRFIHKVPHWLAIALFSAALALIIAGISIGTLIAIVLGIKNREAIMEVWASLKKVVEKPTEKALRAPVMEKVAKVAPVISVAPATDQVLGEVKPLVEECAAEIGRQGYAAPFDVSRHIRTLSEGRHASPEKVEAALKLNIVLQDGQTWVEGYTKGVTAA